MVVPRAESCFFLLRFARSCCTASWKGGGLLPSHPVCGGVVTAQAFNGPKLPLGIACRMPCGWGHMEDEGALLYRRAWLERGRNRR